MSRKRGLEKLDSGVVYELDNQMRRRGVGKEHWAEVIRDQTLGDEVAALILERTKEKIEPESQEEQQETVEEVSGGKRFIEDWEDFLKCWEACKTVPEATGLLEMVPCVPVKKTDTLRSINEICIRFLLDIATKDINKDLAFPRQRAQDVLRGKAQDVLINEFLDPERRTDPPISYCCSEDPWEEVLRFLAKCQYGSRSQAGAVARFLKAINEVVRKKGRGRNLSNAASYFRDHYEILRKFHWLILDALEARGLKK